MDPFAVGSRKLIVDGFAEMAILKFTFHILASL